MQRNYVIKYEVLRSVHSGQQQKKVKAKRNLSALIKNSGYALSFSNTTNTLGFDWLLTQEWYRS